MKATYILHMVNTVSTDHMHYRPDPLVDSLSHETVYLCDTRSDLRMTVLHSSLTLEKSMGVNI